MSNTILILFPNSKFRIASRTAARPRVRRSKFAFQAGIKKKLDVRNALFHFAIGPNVARVDVVGQNLTLNAMGGIVNDRRLHYPSHSKWDIRNYIKIVFSVMILKYYVISTLNMTTFKTKYVLQMIQYKIHILIIKNL